MADTSPKATALRRGEGAHEDQEANIRSPEAITLTLDVSRGRVEPCDARGLADGHRGIRHHVLL